MRGERDALRQRRHRTRMRMRDDMARIHFDLELVPCLADLHPVSDPGDRNRVANGVHRDVAFHVHYSLMQAIHFRNPRRQRFEMHALHCEQFARHRADMLLVGRVDLVAPLARLLVQILPTGECAPRQKVVFDEGERALHARRTIGIADLVRHKAEPETFRERLHLGHRNHFTPRAAQHHHMRVVDHHPLGHAAGMA